MCFIRLHINVDLHVVKNVIFVEINKLDKPKMSSTYLPVSLNTASTLSALCPIPALLSACCMGVLQWLSAL